MNILAPKNYTELVESCEAAAVLTYVRDAKTINVTIDDKSSDRRTVITFRMNARTAGVAEIKTLCRFDAKKNIWQEYCRPCGEIEFQNRRGQKALLEWLRQKALMQDEFSPNPAMLTVYSQ